MRILLLYNTFLPEVHWNCLKAQEKNMGAIPPLNLCYVASIVRQYGHDVQLIDLQIEHYSFNDLIVYIKEYKPDILGFTITTYLFHPVREWIKRIKEMVEIPVLVGGFHMNLYPFVTMTHSEIDFAVIGYGQETLRDFLHQFDNYDTYPNIEGLCYKRDGQIYINQIARKEMIDFDTMPFPARDLLKNEKYGNFISRKKNFTVMLTGVGCHLQCKYCASTLTQCLMRSPENVVDEIEECFHTYNIREIDFYDQTFTLDKKRTLAICNEIIKRKIKIIWTIRTRTDLVDKELMEGMKEAGLYRIMYGVESADQEIINRLNKNEHLSRMKETIHLTHRYGIHMLGFFMLGCPGETEESIMKTRKFAVAMPFDDIQVTRFTLFPGTAFYQEYLKKTGHDDYWRSYIVDRRNVRKLPLLDTAFTPEEIEIYVKKMYLVFYIRIKIVLRKLMEGDFLYNIQKYGKAFFDMIFN